MPLRYLEIRSTKYEMRNKLKIKNPNEKNYFLNFGHFIFGFVSSFDIRISNVSDFAFLGIDQTIPIKRYTTENKIKKCKMS